MAARKVLCSEECACGLRGRVAACSPSGPLPERPGGRGRSDPSSVDPPRKRARVSGRRPGPSRADGGCTVLVNTRPHRGGGGGGGDVGGTRFQDPRTPPPTSFPIPCPPAPHPIPETVILGLFLPGGWLSQGRQSWGLHHCRERAPGPAGARLSLSAGIPGRAGAGAVVRDRPPSVRWGAGGLAWGGLHGQVRPSSA